MTGVENSVNTSTKRKYDETEECQYIGHKNGKFNKDSIPEHVFPLGNNLFVTLNAYKRKVKIHIRTYKLHRDTYYPSTDGVTVETSQFNVLSKAYVPPASIFDIVDINMKLDATEHGERDTYYVQMREEKYFTISHEFQCRSGRIYRSSVEIDSLQWAQLGQIRDDVNCCFIKLKYSGVNFKELFKRHAKSTMLKNVSDASEAGIASATMNRILKNIVNNHVTLEKGLKTIHRFDELPEIEEINTLSDFYESCLNLNTVSIITDFESALKKEILYPKKYPLIDYINEEFLNSVNLFDILMLSKIDFCSYDGITV